MDNGSHPHTAQSAPMISTSQSCVDSRAYIDKKGNGQKGPSSTPSTTASKRIFSQGPPPLLRISTPTEEDLKDDFTPPMPPVIPERLWPPRPPVLAADLSRVLDPCNTRDNATRYAVLPELALPIDSFRILSSGSLEILGAHYDRIRKQVLIGDYTPSDWGKELLAKRRTGLELTKGKDYPKLDNRRIAILHGVLSRRVLNDTSHALPETNVAHISNPRGPTAMLQLPETILAKKDLIWRESYLVIHQRAAAQMLAASSLFISHASDLLSNFPLLSVRSKATGKEPREFDFIADHLLGGRRIWITCLDTAGRSAIQMERTRALMNARSLWVEHDMERLLRSFCDGRNQSRNDIPLLTQLDILDKTASTVREALEPPLPFRHKNIKPLTRAKSDPRDDKESRLDKWIQKRPSLWRHLQSDRTPLLKDLKPKARRKGKQIIRERYVPEPVIPDSETEDEGASSLISPRWRICLACRDTEACIDNTIKKGKPDKMGNSSNHIPGCSSRGMYLMYDNKLVHPPLISGWLNPGRPPIELERKQTTDRAERSGGRMNSLQDLENAFSHSCECPPANWMSGSELKRLRSTPFPMGNSGENTSDAVAPSSRPILPRFSHVRSGSLQPMPTPRAPTVPGLIWLENGHSPTSFETMDLDSNNPSTKQAGEADEHFATAIEDQSDIFNASNDVAQHPYFTAIELIEERGFVTYMQDDSAPSTAVNLSVSEQAGVRVSSTDSVSPPPYKACKLETRGFDPETASLLEG